jgi:antitoxin (DNA-binding transcriptional repressor) of toxin-antitoxin stability system
MTVTLEEAQHRLPELLSALLPGDQLFITQDGQWLATLTRAPQQGGACQPGSAKDKILWVSPEFDNYLELRECGK